jgi:uncharacterized protein YmfQ (DUF2313 family)
MSLFTEHTKEEHAQSLANYLPNGFAWISKNIPTSNLRKLLRGLGCELQRVEQKMNEIAYEHDIRTTTLYIEEWEAALGIPDECIPLADTIQGRRDNLLLKLFLSTVVTVEDFEALALMLRFTVKVRPGGEAFLFPYTFPIIFGVGSEKEARNTILINFIGADDSADFTMTFPFTFGDPNIGQLRCLFERVKPATAQIIYIYT